MSSPAERYAAARRRAAQASTFPALDEFALDLGFDLDDFQREACQALERGSGVLVCAPTGAGKTVVGEFAVHLALRGTPAGGGRRGRRRHRRRKCFYTTPIKALSNQKYHDLVDRYGAEQVGLLTGDNAINGDAPVVVMTTEVLRNMLYAGSATLEGLAYVVMDEVHYLADRFRGGVWEEVIIHLPASVTLVSLSATVSNAEEFADWLVTVRGETAVVVSEHRPVPLWQHMLVGKRMFDLFHDADAARKHDVHPELLRYTRDTMRRLELGEGRSAGPGGGPARPALARPDAPRHRRPARPGGPAPGDPVHLQPGRLRRRRAAVPRRRAAADLAGGARRDPPGGRVAGSPPSPARTCPCSATGSGSTAWSAAWPRTTPACCRCSRRSSRSCSSAGLVKAVFATETLALGINMPARCVVLERLVKFNGEAHVDLTPGEYTQLTGRAGRRGIDVEGHAVVVWSPETDPRHVAGLASTRTYPLRSSFRPSYNMAVNLVGTRRRRAGPRAAGVLVRPVPGGPVGGRPGPAGAAQHRDHRGVRRGGRLPPRRLRRVLRAAGGDRRPGTGHRPAGADPAQGGGGRLAGAAAGRRRDPGAVRAAGRAGRGARPGHRRLR